MGKQMKVLAVDDDPVFLDLLLTMLAAEGFFDVATASSGAAALKLLDESAIPFDCLLLDIQMPGVSGVELCGMARKHKNYRHTPIVMITAMSGKRFIDDAFGAGATDYMAKPLDRHDLKARMGMVTQLLTERRNAELAVQAGLAGISPIPDFDFAKPMLINGVDRAIELLALENYLLMLAKSRLHSVTAIGIQIENARFLYDTTDNGNFVNILGDVANALFSALKVEDVLVSYVGSGCFVCVMRSALTGDLDQIEDTIAFELDGFADIYAADRLPLPKVRLSALVRNSVFGVMRPVRILEQVLQMPKRNAVSVPAWRRLVA